MGENEKKLAGVIMWNEAAEKFKDVQDTSDTAIINQQLVESYFGDLSAKKILDIGCGYGWYSNIFRQKGAEVVGCDGADKMIELARENYPECKFELVDIQKKLPYKDESFDMVFCNQVLMDIEDIDIVQSEISRVLKNHGTYFWGIVHPAFYFGEWNLDSKGCRVSRNVSHYTKNFKFLQNLSWGKTIHYHRPVSYYVNNAASHQLFTVEMLEPGVSDRAMNRSDLSVFLFVKCCKIK